MDQNTLKRQMTAQSDQGPKSLTIKNQLSEASLNYRKSGNHQFFLDNCFKYGQCVDSLIPESNYEEQNSTIVSQKLDEINTNLSPSPMISRNSITGFNFADDNIQESNSGTEPAPPGDTKETNFTDLMIKRWESHISKIPKVDMTDIQTHNFNVNGGESCTQDMVNQADPEYTQLSYLRLRSMEEVFSLFNYLDTKQNTKFKEFLDGCFQDNKNSNLDLTAVQTGRTKGIQKIIFLHQKKGYKIETLFIACNIFDRYLCIVGHWNFPAEKIMALACTSILLAAKLEQDTCPDFNMMIQLLQPIERQGITKAKLEDLELDVITRFGYEFNYPGPIESMQRFLRLVHLNKDKSIEETCLKILKFQLKFAVFLKYRPSLIAACSVVLANNFHQKGQYIDHALTDCSIWECQEVEQASGYTSEHLREPLQMLAQHLQQKSNILQFVEKVGTKITKSDRQ